MKKHNEKHMFVIPTHRNCEKAIISIINEMNICLKYYKDVFLLVLDNGEQEVYNENEVFICKMKSEKHVEIMHINMQKISCIIDELATKANIDKLLLRKLLLPQHIDYGKIFNLIFLCAISLHVDVIHRRDSDCYLLDISLSDYPINMELKYINQAINMHINELEVHLQDEFTDDEKICIVGSDYAGNWNLDLQELKQYDSDVIKKVLRLSNIPEEDIEIENSVNYVEVPYTKPNGNAVLDNTFDFEYNVMPECGNVSMCEIYRYIPNIIGEFGIGYDYFTYFMAYLFKIPIVFHKNKILHVHDSKRYKSINIVNYWIGMYKNIFLDMIYTDLIQTKAVEKLCENGKGIYSLRKNEHEICNLLSQSLKNITREKEEKIINSICKDILMYSPLEKYKKAGKIILEEKNIIIEETRADIENSIELLKLWPQLVLVMEENEMLSICKS